MKFLPFRHLVILSTLCKQEAISQLAANLQSRKIFSIGIPPHPESPKPYEGFILGDTFSINRVGMKGNSFRPILEGFFHKDSHGTRIELKMKLPIGISAFIAFLSAVIGLLLIYVTLDGILWEERILALFSLPLSVLFILYLKTLYFFYRDFIKVLQFFAELYPQSTVYEV